MTTWRCTRQRHGWVMWCVKSASVMQAYTVTVDTSHAEGATLDQPMVASALYTTKALNQPVGDAEKIADTIIAHNLAH